MVVMDKGNAAEVWFDRYGFAAPYIVNQGSVDANLAEMARAEANKWERMGHMEHEGIFIPDDTTTPLATKTLQNRVQFQDIGRDRRPGKINEVLSEGHVRYDNSDPKKIRKMETDPNLATGSWIYKGDRGGWIFKNQGGFGYQPKSKTVNKLNHNRKIKKTVSAWDRLMGRD